MLSETKRRCKETNKETKLAVLYHPPSVITQQQHAEEPPAAAANLLVHCFTQNYDLINLGMLLALIHSQV